MVMRIKELRLHAGISQHEMACSLGVLQTAVCNWETEVALPRTRQLPALAKLLGCTISDLFAEPEELPA